MHNPDHATYPALLAAIRALADSTPDTGAHAQIAMDHIRNIFKSKPFLTLEAIDLAYAKRVYLGSDELTWAEQNCCVNDDAIKSQIDRLFEQLQDDPRDPQFFLNEVNAMVRYIRSDSFRRGSGWRAELILKALGAKKNDNSY